MEEIKSLICTRCGSHHIEMVNNELFRCTSCDALIKMDKAFNFEKEYKRLIEEGKTVDIANLRSLVKKALEGHIDKALLTNTCAEILKILPDDVLSLFYIKYVNRNKNPFEYESFLESLIYNATITEMDEIINVIISSTKKREEEKVRKLSNYFYQGKYDNAINESLKQRTKEIDLFSDVPRDIFICHSSLDKDKVNEILNMLEEDGNTCWISSRNIPWDSDNYWDNITKAIKSCNIFLCLNSINTMQSNDCRREVEIARSLNKKRIEYKLDDSRDITLFKQFFTGQWITNIDDLLIKVYDLKNKDDVLKSEAFDLINKKDYSHAKELFEELKKISNDREADKYIEMCELIISAKTLMASNMYEEAKAKLLQINDIVYTKELLEECNRNITISNASSYEDNNREGTSKNEVLKKTMFLLNQIKDYQEAEKYLFEEITNNENDYDLWYYYLYAITKGFKENTHKNLYIALNSLARLASSEKLEEVEELDRKLNPETIKRLEEQKKKEKEEESKKQIEIDKEKSFELNIEKLKGCTKGDIIEFGLYPQTIKARDVNIISSNPDANGYYIGSDGDNYVLHKANPQGNYTFSNRENIVNGKEYYFKVEPIKWKVLDSTDDKVLLFSEVVLNAHAFDENNSNDYEASSIRKWLNNDFYNKAFNDREKDLILTDVINNEKVIKKLFIHKKVSSGTLNDKVFLLSKEEVTNTLYGFKNDNDRCKKVTDYAKANNAFEYYKNKNGGYWLRTPYASDKPSVYDVNRDGNVNWFYVNAGILGIVPALCFDKNK
ncbi:MAG: DUF6273 domain-containing protein [Bacilli bacterium]|nr:DUF6273 domain-containing protein [Bacilli bacterium]